MSSAKGPGANGGASEKGGKGKDGTIAKAAGAAIVAGIAWSIYKSFTNRKEDDEFIEETYGSSPREDYNRENLGIALQGLESEVKEKTDELGSEAGYKASSFYNEGKKKASKATGKFKSSLTYEINKGDTLYGISRKYGVSVDALKASNGLFGDNIVAGDKLVIPNK